MNRDTKYVPTLTDSVSRRGGQGRGEEQGGQYRARSPRLWRLRRSFRRRREVHQEVQRKAGAVRAEEDDVNSATDSEDEEEEQERVG